MSHKPGHIGGELATTWQALYDEAKAAGIDAETQPLVVNDESRFGALEALAAVGGATVTDAEGGGKNVALSFADEVEGEHDEEPEATAAAKRHTFADPEAETPAA